jgi:hypothetical protein
VRSPSAFLEATEPTIAIQWDGRPVWSIDLLAGGLLCHRLAINMTPTGAPEANMEAIAGLWLTHGQIEPIVSYLRA